MLSLTVLSPHRDDAVFSLCLALSQWSRMNISITVVNFFTISSYAPQSKATEKSEVSREREMEDREALAVIDPAIRIESQTLLDAPLRLNIAPATISAPENATLQPEGETAELASLILPYLRGSLAFAPLALGDHIDHQAVRRAATSLPEPERLGFYEDLPYATWTSDEQLAARVEEIEARTGVALEPKLIKADDAVEAKLRVVSRYRSQIRTVEAEAIAGYSSRRGGAERIWIPRGNALWRPLVD